MGQTAFLRSAGLPSPSLRPLQTKTRLRSWESVLSLLGKPLQACAATSPNVPSEPRVSEGMLAVVGCQVCPQEG